MQRSSQNRLRGKRVIHADFSEMQTRQENLAKRKAEVQAWNKLREEPEFNVLQTFAEGYTKLAIEQADAYLDMLGKTQKEVNAALYVALETGGLTLAEMWQKLYEVSKPEILRGLNLFQSSVLLATAEAQSETWASLASENPKNVKSERVVLTEWLDLLKDEHTKARKQLLGASDEEKKSLKMQLIVADILCKFTSAANNVIVSQERAGMSLDSFHDLVNQLAELVYQLSGGKLNHHKEEMYAKFHDALIIDVEFFNWAREPYIVYRDDDSFLL